MVDGGLPLEAVLRRVDTCDGDIEISHPSRLGDALCCVVSSPQTYRFPLRRAQTSDDWKRPMITIDDSRDRSMTAIDR